MFYLQLIMYTICIMVIIFFWVSRTSLNYWKSRGILHKPPHKLYGHLKDVGHIFHLSDILEQHYHTYKRQAPFIGFYMWLKPMIIILDVDLVHNILDKDAEQFTQIGFFNTLHNNNLSKRQDNNDIKWQQLNMNNINGIMISNLNCIYKTMKMYLEEKISNSQKTTMNISQLIESFNIDTLSNLIFDLAIGNTSMKTSTATSTVSSYLYRKSQFLSTAKRYIKENTIVHKSYFNLNYEILANFRQSNIEHKICDKLVKIILDMRNEMNHSHQLAHCLDTIDKELCYNMYTYLLSTLQVLNAVFTCCLYELAKQPEIQSRANSEITKVLKHYNNQLTIEALKDLVYVKQVLNETLRKHTPYPFLLRVAATDYEITESIFMLQKNNYLIIPISAIHHDAEYYANPQKYDPEHFHEAQEQKRPMSTFLPFGLGPKSCIAQQCISFYMLIGLVTLLKDFQYQVSTETPNILECDTKALFLKLKNDVNLLVKKI